jgi:hypothetical protein
MALPSFSPFLSLSGASEGTSAREREREGGRGRKGEGKGALCALVERVLWRRERERGVGVW